MPTDHENIFTQTCTSTSEFRIRHKKADPIDPRVLKVTTTALGKTGSSETFDVEIDLTQFTSSSYGSDAPVFSLYNLGLQSWKHDINITGLSYLDPVTGLPTRTVPANPVRWVKNFPHHQPDDWEEDFKNVIVHATGRVPNGDTSTDGDAPWLPIEAEIWFFQSPESKRFKLELEAIGRKTVGPRQREFNDGSAPAPAASRQETSHGDVPPNLPAGSSEVD